MHFNKNVYLCAPNDDNNLILMEQTEKLLINQLKEGDERAYKFLYDRHYQVLCHIAAQYVHDDFLAETIVGDVIFHLWEVRKKVEIKTNLRSYLMTSVRNRCIDYQKSQSGKSEIPFSSSCFSDFPVISYVKTDDMPLGRLLAKELETNISSAIDHLPKETRQVFRMSRFENKKYEEISEELGISVNTVKYHIKRALALLHDELRQYMAMAVMILLQQMD